MRLIMRADDVGYTPVYNMGVFRCVDEGVLTHIELMLDSMGAVDAMEKLRERPWLSVGWHDHWFGYPVADPNSVSSLLDNEGRFKFRYSGPLGGPNSAKAFEGVKYEEALVECRAQIERCIRVMGRAPDITWLREGDQVEEARWTACEEYGIAYNTGDKHWPMPEHPFYPAQERFKACDVYNPVMKKFSEYNRDDGDLLGYFRDDPDQMADHKAPIVVFHPGFMDVYMFRDKTGHVFNPNGKFRENDFLCSDALKQWIIDNKVELINHRDAIYGTKDYQNYLKACKSLLAV